MFKSQEEFRMNSKKIISSVSLATAVLATGIISQEEEAHADSVENNQEAQAQAQSAADSKKQTFGVCFLDT